MTLTTARPLRILVVEDEDDARANLQDILEMDGHAVKAAASAGKALDELMWPAPDVLIIDRNLPDGQAEEWIPAMKAKSTSMDTIVVTAYADLNGTIHAMREGVADYLIKPINPEALLASLHRIAERRQIERERDDERAFAAKVLDTAEAIVLVLDLDGNIVRFNRFFEELSGYSLDEVQGKRWLDYFIPERDRERLHDVFHRTVQRLETRGVLNPIRTRFGRLRQIRWSNRLLRDRSGNVQHVLAVGLDVTDLVDAQERVLQSERLATIGQTMTALAHESRNALQRIQAGVELLELELDGSPEGLNDLNRIERAAQDLRALLEEVRSYAAPIQLERSVTTVQSIWRRAWDSLQSLREKRDATLIEESDQNSYCFVDSRRMQQVFRNLFENALALAKDPVCVECSCRQVGTELEIRVCDNGPGLDGACFDRLFHPFFTTRPSGTGLGLAIVQRIVEAHGGTISAVPHGESQGGAEFQIILPAGTPHQDHPTEEC